MMFQFKPALRFTVAVCLATLAGHASADWAQSPNPMIIAVAPKNLATQYANPPVFTWARHTSSPPAYVVEITTGGTVYKTYTVNRNWLFPAEKFARGTYQWRVRPSNSAAAWSDTRTFVIDSNAQDFVVDDNVKLRQSIAAKPHPRSVQTSMPIYANWSAALKAERGPALAKMRENVDWAARPGVLALPKDSDWPLASTAATNAATVAQQTAVRLSISNNSRQVESAALLYRLTGEKKYLDEALLRGDAMAALSVDGPTSYANQDQGTRMLTLALAKGLDMLGSNVGETRRAAWLSVIDKRATAMYADLSGSNGRMDQYPFDSHGGTNLGYLALIAALTVGDVANADTWFDFSFRAMVASTSVWGGPEGGFANGTAYAEYTAEGNQQLWQPLEMITGVNLFDKPWSRGFANFLMQFVPPGSTRQVFGDEHELAPNMRSQKGFVARYATPQAAWYFNNVPTAMDGLTLLQAPYPLPVSSVTTPAPPPNAAVFPSIGWTAMHSNMADANRTSVFFKSSAYGSYNHSHADQNSFVITKGGKPLLVETGYSDYYGSPLSEAWYRQTKAHNAITYDGGVGQVTGGYTTAGYNKQMMYGGKITAFSTTAAVDYAEGDATPTYDGALTKAVRKLWYLRNQDAVVILDTLVAPVARKFEWNVHALAPMTFDTATKAINITDATGTQRACVRPIATAPDFGLERRIGALPKAGVVEDHAAYVSSVARTSQEFLILVDIGCKKPTVAVMSSSSARTLIVGTQTIVLPR